ncbi:MAG: hypothetical protein A2583_01815 [Bdellovibrionales bacterium RIFOXYD1_FULL_53_11]|nr:MAG: hypothetical protein A2583_01815 [Bdellovibrionales bacterium RIFOXYD1_FULL_53_11]
MLSKMRTKFGPILVGIIIAFIAFVFVFYGVFNPRSTRGLHEGSVAGTVNGDSITLSEFSRELGRRMDMLRSMGGGKITEAQIKSMRIREMVFSELVNRKLMLQAAIKEGMQASDEEVRDRIREMDVFRKNGAFDADTYKRVLEANNFSPTGFEKSMREDVTLQGWNGFFRSRVRIAEEEIRREFISSETKRDIKYVLLTPETGRKGGKIPESEKSTKVGRINEELAGKVLQTLAAEKASDAKVNAILKPFGVEVKTTGPVARQAAFLPSVGEVKELVADAFSVKNPIFPANGGKAKKYSVPAGIIVALVTAAQNPDMTKFDLAREKLQDRLAQRKEREMFDVFLKRLHEKAKIDPNPDVIKGQGEEEGASASGGD